MTEKARVLFVDDERRVLNSMRGMFRRDFDLFLTTEGAAAVKIAAETPMDVVVADQRMPGMSGIEVLSRVKDLSPDSMRILLTGYADPAAVEGSINKGEVFRFLAKPCSPDLLRETLQQAVDTMRSIRAERDRRSTQAEARPVSRELPSIIASDLRSSSDPEQPVSSSPSSAAPSGRVDRVLSRLTSMGNVAFTWDAYKRKLASDPAAASTAASSNVGVALYTVDSAFAESAIRAVSPRRSVDLATSLINVMRTIEKGDVGVLVTDISRQTSRLQRIIGALKQMCPELVTIVVTNSRDSTEMIRLINYGQVYRHVVKPIDQDPFVADVEAAVAKHLDLQSHPESVLRHSVMPPPENSWSRDHAHGRV